jgi:RNA polymerase sigma factor (sigma-70 family)
VNAGHRIEDLLRELAPQVLGTLVRRHGQFGACEDAVQQALLAAALQWPAAGIPGKPRSWLVTVADRSLVDCWRAESARRRREAAAAALDPASRAPAGNPGIASHPAAGRQDDTLVLLFLCCHPALSPPSQLALTLRAVGGLTTAEIAAAFLVPEATIGQRIRRAKQRIRSAGPGSSCPPNRSGPSGSALSCMSSTSSSTRDTPQAQGRRCTETA